MSAGPDSEPQPAGWYPVSPAVTKTKPTPSQTARKLSGIAWLCLVLSFPLSLFSLYWIGAVAVIASALLAVIAGVVAIVGLTRREGSTAVWALVSSGVLVMVFLLLLGAGVAMSQ